jgi:ApbE superfamily uncharacterized protein (UPF0280 family)
MGEDDVMIFTNKETAVSIEQQLKENETTYTEVYEVKDSELQYYIYEPCFLND